jgi:SAM-dependent methyltransferase
MSLLDVGCGPGNITADLAARLSAGSVIGIDVSDEVIELARSQYHEVRNLSFEVANVYGLKYPDESFDIVYAHQVLQHLAQPVDALREMRRVLKTGGTLAVRDGDYGSFAWAPSDPVLDRWMALYHEITRVNHAEADAGRHLKTWVRAAQFDDLAVTSSNWIYQSDDERSWWGGLWADRVLHSEFARQGIEYGLTSVEELQEISRAFLRWCAEPNGIFVIVNIEILATRA